MDRISQWYPLFGEETFPTVFLKLNEAECTQFLQAGDSPAERDLEKRVDRAIDLLPGSCVVGLDSCAPSDSAIWQKDRSISSGAAALKLLRSSLLMRDLIQSGKDTTLIVRPYRRMDRTREFRLFIKGGKLTAMSQRHLDRHFARLEEMKDTYWQRAGDFAEKILAPHMSEKDFVADIYFTSDGAILIVDFNLWGAPTSPLLFRTWERDWAQISGLKLMQPPMALGGDVKVSF